METRVPNLLEVIPDTIVSVLSLLDSEKDRFSWNLSRNLDGFSLVVKSYKPSVRRRAHRLERRKPKGSETANVDILEKVSTDSARNDSVHPRPEAKHKSPSVIARNKARRQRYRLRKKLLRAANRRFRKIAKKTSPDSVHTEQDNPRCDSEERQSSVNTVDSLDCSSSANLPSADCVNLHPENSAHNTTEIDSDDGSNISEQQSAPVNSCARCTKECDTESNCPSCANTYCSKECQSADWGWHKFVCKNQTD